MAAVTAAVTSTMIAAATMAVAAVTAAVAEQMRGKSRALHKTNITRTAKSAPYSLVECGALLIYTFLALRNGR